ncbi:MAG: DUF3097 domain-containing protein [Bifidobacteriaceae bacterium]|jgi:hypothetical protein|nr:DUF3097 domain-containing protein [Bifidobacteriaceae bacterium]
MSRDPYGPDVLAHDPHAPRLATAASVAAEAGLVVEDVETGWVGAIVRVEKAGGMHVVVLEDRHGRLKSFRLGGGFWIDGQPVTLVTPGAAGPGGPEPRRTASGSRAVAGAKAKVARQSRIWVEGRHDAELIGRVWGEDLALEGVVVEMLDGVDNLAARVAEFAPDGERRLGVLVDHLVAGSKESRIAGEVAAACPAGSILILGHPYVDVWQAIKPERVGLSAWPRIERGQEWKAGVLERLGWPPDQRAAWAKLLGRVRGYQDLEPALLGRVEELIDFVSPPPK